MVDACVPIEDKWAPAQYTTTMPQSHDRLRLDSHALCAGMGIEQSCMPCSCS